MVAPNNTVSRSVVEMEKLLADYSKKRSEPGGLEHPIAELIADVILFCEYTGVDFDVELERGRGYVQADKAEG